MINKISVIPTLWRDLKASSSLHKVGMTTYSLNNNIIPSVSNTTELNTEVYEIMIINAFNYKRWADKRTLEAVDYINKTTHPKSYAFTLQQINHMVIVEELFKSRLENYPAPHNSTNSDKVPNFNELKYRFKESSEWYSEYISTLDSKKKQINISFSFADGKLGSMSVEEILFHIVNHSSYHRGAIAHALDLAAVAHPVDGYGIYIHEKEFWRREQT